jgi:hypothetical protein
MPVHVSSRGMHAREDGAHQLKPRCGFKGSDTIEPAIAGGCTVQANGSDSSSWVGAAHAVAAVAVVARCTGAQSAQGQRSQKETGLVGQCPKVAAGVDGACTREVEAVATPMPLGQCHDACAPSFLRILSSGNTASVGHKTSQLVPAQTSPCPAAAELARCIGYISTAAPPLCNGHALRRHHHVYRQPSAPGCLGGRPSRHRRSLRKGRRDCCRRRRPRLQRHHLRVSAFPPCRVVHPLT